MEARVSTNFKKNAVKTVCAIILFIIVYLFLFLFSLLLTIACVIGGILLVAARPGFLTLLIGIGVGALGVFILIFLFKFLFKKHRYETSRLTEITRVQEPELFRLIDDVVTEVKTGFPKKIYLSEDVNAGVFYDSGFWSMFISVPKNLQIGLGLINTVTEQEFKAILAHEFGHFSQRSMKIGSYVYNVNVILHNMLYDNETFERMIQRWMQFSSFFSVFVVIAAKIIQGMQQILSVVYSFVNAKYMALSREMEFHADEVAANVVGSAAVKESLLRSDLSVYAYCYVLDFYENKIPDNLKSENIYKEHKFILNFFAEKNGIVIKNDFPQVSLSNIGKYNRSKLNVKNPWASHPETKERLMNLEKTDVAKESESDSPAIFLLSDCEETERIMTKKLFENISFKEEATYLSFEDFKKEISEYYNNNSFPAIYNGYYDEKNIIPFRPEEITVGESDYTIEALFGSDKMELIYSCQSLVYDMNILESIVHQELDVKLFSYAGQKYKLKDAAKLHAVVEKELNVVQSAVLDNDIKIYSFFYKVALKGGSEAVLEEKYIDLFKEDEAYEFRIKYHELMIKSLQFLSISMPYEEIKRNFENVSTLEVELKTEIRKLLEEGLLQSELKSLMRENLEKYQLNDLEYFHGISYDDENLQLLLSVLNDFQYLTSRSYFLKKLDLLKFQYQLLQ